MRSNRSEHWSCRAMISRTAFRSRLMGIDEELHQTLPCARRSAARTRSRVRSRTRLANLGGLGRTRSCRSGGPVRARLRRTPLGWRRRRSCASPRGGATRRPGAWTGGRPRRWTTRTQRHRARRLGCADTHGRRTARGVDPSTRSRALTLRHPQCARQLRQPRGGPGWRAARRHGVSARAGESSASAHRSTMRPFRCGLV